MIKLIKPYVTFDDVEPSFRKIFESGIFTRGAYVNQLSDLLKDYLSVKYVFPVTSATTALWIALKALKIGPGDNVLVSDFSFPASANVIEDLGATPIFIDVEPSTFNINRKLLEKKFNSQTKAVMFVDALGNPANIHEIKQFCSEKSIPLLEDAACALGSSSQEVPSGKVADISCFSFHPRKLLTSGEGGLITTDRDDIADFLRIKLMHGATTKENRMYFSDFGYNFRLSELHSAMLIGQIQNLDRIVEKRRFFQKELTALISTLGFVQQHCLEGDVHNIQSLTYVTPETLNRDFLIKALARNGLESTLGTYSMSSTDYYQRKYETVCATSKMLQDNTISLPCHDQVTPKEVFTILKRSVEELCE